MSDPHPWSVGSVCIGQNFQPRWGKYNGMECTITAPLQQRTARNPASDNRIVTAPGYIVIWADGREATVPPEKLRRRIPRQPDRRSKVMTGLRTVLDLFKERETSTTP